MAGPGCPGQRPQIEDLLPGVDRHPPQGLSVGTIDLDVQRGQVTPRAGITLVHQLDEVIVSRLVERDGQESGEAT